MILKEWWDRWLCAGTPAVLIADQEDPRQECAGACLSWLGKQQVATSRSLGLQMLCNHLANLDTHKSSKHQSHIVSSPRFSCQIPSQFLVHEQMKRFDADEIRRLCQHGRIDQLERNPSISIDERSGTNPFRPIEMVCRHKPAHID